MLQASGKVRAMVRDGAEGSPGGCEGAADAVRGSTGIQAVLLGCDQEVDSMPRD